MEKNKNPNLNQEQQAPSAVTIGQAFLRNRKFRRNLLFGFTLLTIFLVFGGAVVLGEKLMEHPVAFLLFWLICFSLVGFILMLAIYDLGRIRKEHRRQVRSLDRELDEISDEAARLAAEALKKDAESD